jgi:hypothetical protein
MGEKATTSGREKRARLGFAEKQDQRDRKEQNQ